MRLPTKIAGRGQNRRRGLARRSGRAAAAGCNDRPRRMPAANTAPSPERSIASRNGIYECFDPLAVPGIEDGLHSERSENNVLFLTTFAHL
jgi:hypothetical protein